MKELIELAKENEFESDHFDIEKTEHTDKVYYLWLCDLQKWLRDNYKICVTVQQYVKDEKYNFEFWVTDKSYYLCETHKSAIQKYDQALEKGIFEALNLIK